MLGGLFSVLLASAVLGVFANFVLSSSKFLRKLNDVRLRWDKIEFVANLLLHDLEYSCKMGNVSVEDDKVTFISPLITLSLLKKGKEWGIVVRECIETGSEYSDVLIYNLKKVKELFVPVGKTFLKVPVAYAVSVSKKLLSVGVPSKTCEFFAKGKPVFAKVYVCVWRGEGNRVTRECNGHKITVEKGINLDADGDLKIVKLLSGKLEFKIKIVCPGGGDA